MSDVVVLIDREQGGRARLASQGLALHSAFTLRCAAPAGLGAPRPEPNWLPNCLLLHQPPCGCGGIQAALARRPPLLLSQRVLRPTPAPPCAHTHTRTHTHTLASRPAPAARCSYILDTLLRHGLVSDDVAAKAGTCCCGGLTGGASAGRAGAARSCRPGSAVPGGRVRLGLGPC